MTDTRISLKVDGVDYKNWKSLTVNRSITNISGSFNFTVSNKYAGVLEQWAIYMGSPCTIELEGKTLISGYVDQMDVRYDADSYDITFSGRDKTADLVDCCHDFDDGENEFLNLTIIQILKKLCDPFSISIKMQTDLTTELNATRERFRIAPGEKVIDHISEICNQFAIMPITEGDGQLLLTRAGTVNVTDKLEGGKNVLSASLSQSDRERFSIYYVKGPSNAKTPHTGEERVGGVIEDEKIKGKSPYRVRPLIINAGPTGTTSGICQKRAAWEARARQAASRKIEVRIREWTQSDGSIWPINALVSYYDKYIGILKDKYLIAGIRYSLSESGGELTTLNLMHPDAFKLQERDNIKNTSESVFDSLQYDEYWKKHRK